MYIWKVLTKFTDWENIENSFSPRNIHFEWLLKAEIDFLMLNQIFVLDYFNVALDKKYFVLVDGQGNCSSYLPFQK